MKCMRTRGVASLAVGQRVETDGTGRLATGHGRERPAGGGGGGRRSGGRDRCERIGEGEGGRLCLICGSMVAAIGMADGVDAAEETKEEDHNSDTGGEDEGGYEDGDYGGRAVLLELCVGDVGVFCPIE